MSAASIGITAFVLVVLLCIIAIAVLRRKSKTKQKVPKPVDNLRNFTTVSV